MRARIYDKALTNVQVAKEYYDCIESLFFSEEEDAEPYFDLVFENGNVKNGTDKYVTVTMKGGSVGMNTVQYNGNSYDVLSYRGV